MMPAPAGPEPAIPNAAVIVAHPDDETLWAGGTILSQTGYHWFIAAVCRQSDPQRAPRFFRVLQSYNAQGGMADLDDGPEQAPLPAAQVEHAILSLLPMVTYDLILTHAPQGEYTRHRRHEEVSQAVKHLWQAGRIDTRQLWMFAYEDGDGQHLPQAIENAHQYQPLEPVIRGEKYRLITEVYGFSPQSWEARAAPGSEAFWCFDSPLDLQAWLELRRPL